MLPVRRHSGPPPLVDHVDVGDDVVRIKRNLCVVSCKVEIKSCIKGEFADPRLNKERTKYMY